jgi:hypothetical protein
MEPVSITLTLAATILVAFITSVLGPNSVVFVQNYLNKKKRQDPIKEAIQHNSLIDHQLDTVMDELQCDRVWIAQFHNGGNYYPTGKSIQKFSISFERIKGNNTSIIETFQNIPISLFPKTFSKLNEDSEVHLVYNDLNAYDLDLFHKLYTTKSMYIFKVEDLDSRFVGILALEYNEEKLLLKDEFIFIRQKMGIIGSMLDSYLNPTKK